MFTISKVQKLFYEMNLNYNVCSSFLFFFSDFHICLGLKYASSKLYIFLNFSRLHRNIFKMKLGNTSLMTTLILCLTIYNT